MNITPLVSIVMCCYNGQRFIDRSFCSILEQTYPNIELIFVNDGSTDDSVDYAESYRGRFEKKGYLLRVYSQENQGFSYASLNGLRKVQGEFMSFLDVDDYLMPDSILLKVRFLLEHLDFNVVRTNGYEVFEGDLANTSRLLVRTEKEKKEEHIFKDLLMGRTNNWAGTYMIRMQPLKEFYQDKEMPISKYGQNLQVLLPLTRFGKAGFIDIPLMKYIRNVQSYSMANLSLEKELTFMRGYWDIRRTMLELMEVTDSGLIRECEMQYLNNAMNQCLYYNDASQYNVYYTKLKTLVSGRVDLKTKMEHALINKRPSSLFYRIAFKLKNCLSI